jgi:hypothetical protein
MSSYSDRELLALDQMEDLLEAYADARLSPTGPVLARMRAQVLAQAATMASIHAAARRVLDTGEARAPRWSVPRLTVPRLMVPRLTVPRRAFSVVGAGLLTVAMTTAVLGAPAGSPFYNARVAVEAAFLPSQPDARLAAQEAHLAERLAEAEAAAAKGDVVALDAALAAYKVEVEAAVSDVVDSADKVAKFETVLAKHVATLEALGARLTNEQASQNAVDHAAQASERAIEKLKAKADQGNQGGGKPAPKPPNPNKPDRE